MRKRVARTARVSLTIAQMHRRIWVQAHAQNVTIKLRGEHESLWGWVDVSFGERRVKVYANKAEDIIRTLVHELIHDAFRVELAPWGALEEEIVLMLEQRVWSFIALRPSTLVRWRKYVAVIKGEQ